jgi:hypothetical protein
MIMRKNKEIYLTRPSGIFTKTDKYAPKPTRAKELFNNKESHKPRPAMVPKIGPKALSIYKYVPPEAGMAVASSDLDKAAGKIHMAASK